MNVSRKPIVYNSFFSLVDKGYTAISNVVLIPFIVRFLGLDTYGIWVILNAVASYFQLANLGINFSYEKFIAQFHATGDERSLKRFIVTAFYASIALGVVILVVSQQSIGFVFNSLLKNGDLGRFSTIFFLIMLSSVCSLITMILTAVPRGLQRYDYASAISIGARTCFIIAVVVLGLRGSGMMALVVAQYVFILGTVVLSVLFARRFFRGLSLDPRQFDWSILHMMLAFGIKMQVSAIALIITQSFDKLLIARFLGPRVVALYDIGSRLIVFLKDVPTFLFASITSRTSELHSQGNRTGLQELYLIGTKYLSVMCFGFVPLLLPVAGAVLTIYMRRAADPLSVYVFQVLLVSTMVNASTGLASSMGVGINRPGILAYSSAIMTLINVACSVLFFHSFGSMGIVWGTAAGLFVSTIVCFVLLNRGMDIPARRFLSSSFLTPIAVNAGLVVVLVKLQGLSATMAPAIVSGAWGEYWRIAVNTVLALALSAGMYAATKFITVKEVREYVPFFRKATPS
jgi:O-antigen/teichoic acid export membrane protein